MPRYNPPDSPKEKNPSPIPGPPNQPSTPPGRPSGVQANQGPPPGPPGHYRNSIHESKGLGDTVSKLIKKVSGGKVKECEPCRKRKEKLNKMWPYKNNDN